MRAHWTSTTGGFNCSLGCGDDLLLLSFVKKRIPSLVLFSGLLPGFVREFDEIRNNSMLLYSPRICIAAATVCVNSDVTAYTLT